MKNLIYALSLFMTLSASAQTLVCEAQIFRDNSFVPEAFAFHDFDLDEKGNLIVSNVEIKSDLDSFIYGVEVKNGVVENIWSWNVYSRIGDTTKGNEAIHTGDGINLKVNCVGK